MKTREEAIEYITKNNGFTTDGNLTSGITRYLRNREDILKEIQTISNCYSDNVSEVLYNLTHPDCKKTCEICGNPVSFDRYYSGYKKACCRECAFKLTSSKGANTKYLTYGDAHYNNMQKNKETKLKNHGDANYNNIEKNKATKKEKYGDSKYNNNQKGKETYKAKTGYDNPMKNPDVIKKINEKNLELEGVMWNSQRHSAKQKQSSNKANKLLNKLFSGNRLDYEVRPMFSKEEYRGVRNLDGTAIFYKFKCLKCGLEFEDHMNNGRVPICRHCHPYEIYTTSEAEKQIVSYVKSIYKGLILENDRNTVHPLELDAYIPEFKVAIEFNGLYWHSDLYKDSSYHLNKTKLCEERGIRLIQIFSDEWEQKQEIVKDLIKTALHIYDNRIYARQCKIKQVEKDIAENFLNSYHIQGSGGPAKYHFGLYYNDELLSMISFKKSGLKKEADWELHRFINKRGWIIVGGFSKLLSFFKKNYPGSIVTYSDRRLFTGEVYRKAGFTECKPLPPEYYYTKNFEFRENRMFYQKKTLLKENPAWKDLTESDIMHLKGYHKIYGCGNWKFILN